jgi:FixJ family two-component response regulator
VAAPERGRASGGSRAAVAVVDDSSLVADLYVELLALLGHAGHAFVGGQAFLTALPALDVDLLILDRRLAGVGGLEIARQTRALRPSLGILMISANPCGDALAAGLIDHALTKPCTITQFNDAVTLMLGPGRRATGGSPADAGG